MYTFLAITKALADKNRLRALLVLNGRELCMCQLIEVLGLAPSTVSKHMSILRQARLINGRKKGRWMYYRLAGEEAPSEVRKAIAWIHESLWNAPRILKDAKRLEGILRIDQEELCKMQRSK